VVKRSLWQCLNAKCSSKRIRCVKGYKFPRSKDGSIDIKLLYRGDPLEFAVCQKCTEYIEMGKPVPKKERGGINTSAWPLGRPPARVPKVRRTGPEKGKGLVKSKK
jgi:hypothetical protein